ncbi:ATP-binding protein [Vibrio sp. Isolate23]|uniref:ATP-binding protein n=1 Tax=Vibrio sp. Isolate23 TaxID=2908533 RepID=UPI001EFE5CEA|nr:ATP-binding protein [Vibrio sp. Isolate23]MCG9681244.1 ATP-binding protein [Vibrio sp. Isolate23]
MSDSLILKFDPNTIEHLGVSLYSKLPSVLSELLSNSWDADADNVTIDFIENGDEKEIIYMDDGEGMTFDELNNKYLVIGRNRRRDTKRQESTKGRPVIGKKGLGKLSVFGICDEIEVVSIKDGLKNHFTMNLQEIKDSRGDKYSPELLAHNESTPIPSGTVIKLKQIRRKSGFNLDDIALSLSKKFIIFTEMDTRITKNGEPDSEVHITNELKFQTLNTEFTWSFPDEKYDKSYSHWEQMKGSVITLKTPVKDTEMRGIYLTSRGKIVNVASFYGARDNDQFHNYVTGYLEVDFIDDFDDDVISTDRHSLNWEHEETRELQAYLQTIVKVIGKEWRERRAQVKQAAVEEKHQVGLEQWKEELPTFERELGDKIITPILENSNIDVDESAELIGNVMDKFDNQAYKEYASSIADLSESAEDIPKLLRLMEEWKSIESKQYRDLATSRVEVIKQFENYVNTNTKEVPTLHNFLKKFSWLLDPRILEFRDEVTYSKLLEETYPDEDLDEKDRRIDFLCSNALGEILYVIEIKRSTYKVDAKALEQAYDYASFLEERYASETGFSRVVCYVVGGSKSEDRRFRSKEKTYAETGEVFVKTYRELLEQSKEYHKEFIEAYDSYNG